MVTMKDIAEYAGVSTATVSKIINGQDRHISSATRERVLALIDEYNYKPNALAKGLKVKKTNTIGFILPDISNPFFPEIARELRMWRRIWALPLYSVIRIMTQSGSGSAFPF